MGNWKMERNIMFVELHVNCIVHLGFLLFFQICQCYLKVVNLCVVSQKYVNKNDNE